MSNQKSEKSISTSSMDVGAITTALSDAIHPRRRIARNFLLIWIDASIDKSTEEYQNTLAQLQSVVNDVNIFTKQDEAIDFLTEVYGMETFLIAGGTIGQHIVPLIHDIPQLDTIYLFCDNEPPPEQWTKKYTKIKGIHTKIESICQGLQLAVKQCNQDSISVSFVSMDEGPSSQNLDQLEPSFMYTQIFKEILLEMDHNEQSIKDFIQLWRQHYINDTFTPNAIAEFERDYCPQSAITWYSREYFLYEMLNRSLRTLEADAIINMGFFIRDLHQQIQELHRNQVSTHHGKPFKVYRGQGLLKTDFDKLVKTKGGLMSFNNFLSTSNDRAVSLFYAGGALGNPNMVGILFEMTIDPSISSAPFASIQEVSYFQQEAEILFSMHTVFRIDGINQIDNNSSLYQVDLKLTADDDQQLRTLTEYIRQEVVNETGWQRLAALLVKIGQIDKAEELYNVLLKQTPDLGEKSSYYNNLGYIKDRQGEYEKAVEYYEKALEIRQNNLPLYYPLLAGSYNNIGLVYNNIAEYSKALSFYEKAFEICQNILPPDHPDLATSYSNIGGVYHSMGQYAKALSFCEKALEIRQKNLPANHPLLATSYNNVALVYTNMREYSKTLSIYEKVLEINKKTLPSNHPDLAITYNNIGHMYRKMGEYLKALSSHEKALEIRQKTLSENHPDLANSYNDIGLVYNNIGEYSKALSFFEKARETWQKNLPSNHPDLARFYHNIGFAYDHMGEYSKALPFYEKALRMREKILPPNHLSLAGSYNNIGEVYRKMGEYVKALCFHEKALEIRQKTLPTNHPDFATSYNNIGLMYDNIGKFSKALTFYEKALEIWQKTLSPNHPSFATLYNNIAGAYYYMDDYSKALSFYELALDILQRSSPSDDYHAGKLRESIEIVKKKLEIDI